MRPTFAVRAETLIGHLGLTRRLKADVQDLSKKTTKEFELRLHPLADRPNPLRAC